MSKNAVIFDLNGTILSDEDEYGDAFRKVLERYGVKVDDKYPHRSGIGLRKNWEIFKEKYSLDTDKNIEDLSAETQEEYRKIFDQVELQDGFVDFVKELKSEGYLIAMATSNSWLAVEMVFNKFDIEEFFDVVTTEEEVMQGKPDPEIFIITAEKLMLPSESCVVFEDSSAGIKAAKEAGMVTIGVFRNDKHKKDLENADKLINDFEEFDLSGIFKE